MEKELFKVANLGRDQRSKLKWYGKTQKEEISSQKGLFIKRLHMSLLRVQM